MNAFSYLRPKDVGGAMAANSTESKFLAGGTNLVDLMKNGVERPQKIIDLNRLPLAAIEPLPDGGLRLGALARNSDTANHPLVREHYPLSSQAILSGASPQLRNLATNGGNLRQRTRCPYFMNVAFPACNKREPGSGCGALHGFNRTHAILGASEHCIAVHPSDMCVALAALDASVQVRGRKGERTIPLSGFHRLPGNNPERDTNLEPDELIIAIDLPPSKFAAHSHYLKVRDRASYEFALVSVATALELENGVVRAARLALGGVAQKPWRAESAEQFLVGKPLAVQSMEAAAHRALAQAVPQRDNAFKVEMAKRAITRALEIAGGIQ